MSIKNLVEMIKRNGLLASMPQLEELYQVAIENELKLAESQREFRAADATIENMQMQVEKLAAESAGLKAAVTHQIELRAEIKKAGRPPHADFWVQSICEAEEKVKRALEETPETDAFLAEVRAQGVEMYAEHLTRRAIASGKNKNHAYAYLAANFAAQLRYEAAQ